MPRLTFVDLEGRVIKSIEIEHPELVGGLHIRDDKSRTCTVFGLSYLMTVECI